MSLPHGLSKFLYLTKVFSHHGPTIPVGIIRIDMEERLISPHAVFHVHLKKYLVNVLHIFNIRSSSTHKIEKIRICKSIVCRLFNDSVLVKIGYYLDGISHQPVSFLHDFVTHAELFPGVSSRVAFSAGFNHLLPFSGPGFLSQPG